MVCALDGLNTVRPAQGDRKEVQGGMRHCDRVPLGGGLAAAGRDRDAPGIPVKVGNATDYGRQSSRQETGDKDTIANGTHEIHLNKMPGDRKPRVWARPCVPYIYTENGILARVPARL